MYVLYVLFLCNVCMLWTIVNGRTLNDNLYRLDIVHYNDFHDRFEETSVSYPVCQSNDTNCLGGFPRLYQEIQLLLKEKPGALLLNAGDVFQGTYWYNLLKWNVTQKFINMLPNDAHAIGNHEFDDGVAGLVPYLAALRAPVVAANMNTTLEPALNGLYKPHVILERRGRKIGIIGLITPETAGSSHSQQVIFLDPIETVRTEAQVLTDQGVDIIIVLSHCGLDVDKNIASNVGENIDIIVGGHTHSLLWNTDSPSNETISGPYPVIVKSEAKPDHKVLVVTASAFTKYLGNLTTYFNEAGELQSFDGDPIFLNRSIPEDPEIKRLLKPYTEELHAIVEKVVGYTTDDLLTAQCGGGECAFGDLMADALLNTTKEMQISNLTHVSFLFRSMLRGSIAKGDISVGAVINAFPFKNKVVAVKLRGKYILEALDKCLTSSWRVKPFLGPWMPQTAGLRITLNTTLLRTVSVEVMEDDDYKPLDMEKDYLFIAATFLTKGGAGFQMLKNGRDPIYIGTDSDILEHYIRKLSPFTPTMDNRLTVVE